MFEFLFIMSFGTGLDYLHTGCVLPIVHRDVKSHNILLGCDLTAKISDFGLSKSYLNVAQSHITATAAGTLGYIDPELVLLCIQHFDCNSMFTPDAIDTLTVYVFSTILMQVLS